MKRLARVTAALLVLLAAAASSGCFNAGLIAKVNGEGISEEVFESEIARYREQYPTMFQNADGEFRFRRTLISQLIDQELLRQAAAKEGVEVPDAELDTQIEGLKKGFQDDAAFLAALEKSGYTLEAFREYTRDQITSQRLITKVAADVTVTDDEVRKQYDDNKDKYVRQPFEMIHVAHILFAGDDEKTAREVRAKIAAGADFAAAARANSKDKATAAKGGDLGWAKMPYAPEFQAAAEKLPVGKVSEPVKTSFGWHIIRMLERKADKQKSFDEVKEQVRQVLFQQRQAQSYQEYLQKLRDGASIEIFDDELKDAWSTPATPTTATP